MTVCQPETRLQNKIRMAISVNCPQATLFRNHCGALKDQRGKMLKFGLSPGSPDLVGWQSVTITADMLGQQLAIFVGIEIKMPGEKPRQEQQHWLNTLSIAGGIAGVATSEIEAISLISSHESHP